MLLDMHKTDSDFWRTARRTLALAQTLLFGQVAMAQWEYGAEVDLGAVRSDNIFLAAETEEEGETIYMVAPQFFMQTEGERLTADFRYSPQALFYSNYDDADSVFHSLDVSMTAALVRERLFFYASAVNFQTVVAPEEQVPSGNIPITGNRLDSRVWQVRPYWQQRIGSARFLLETGYADVDYDDEQFQGSNERHARTQIGNVERQQGFAWEAGYQYRRTEYEFSSPWEFQRASLSLGVWLNGTVRLFGVGGAETAFDNFLEPDMDSEFWEAGLQYTPNQRLNVELAAGDRSYGVSYRGNLNYQLKRGDFQLRYSESPANRAATFFDRRPIIASDNLDGALDRPGSSDRFVQKRGEASITFELSKSQINVRVFSERRGNRTTADGEELPDEEFSGVAVGWEWQVAAKTSVSFGAESAIREQGDADSRLDRYQATIAYRMSRRLSLRLVLSRSRQDEESGGQFEYAEDQIGLFLRTSF